MLWRAGRQRWPLRQQFNSSGWALPLPPVINRAFFIQGQSNAAQMTVGTAVGLDAAFAAVQMYESTAGAGAADPPSFTVEGPRDLAPRLVDFSGAFDIGTGGIELSLGRYLSANTDDIWYCGKQAIDGSSLVNHWANAAYPATGGNMMARSIAFINQQLSAWSVDPDDMVLIWAQGEADGGQTYATYLSSLQTYYGAMRAEFGSLFQIIIVRTVDVVDTAANVRAAQEAFCSDVANNARCVPIDWATLRDTAHWSDQSTEDIGNAIGPIIVDATQTSPYWVVGGPFRVSSSAQTVALTMPPHQAGDILIAYIAGIGQNNYAAPAGWTSCTDSPQHDSGASTNARLQAFWFRAVDSATAAPTVSDVAGDGSKIGTIVVIRGAVASGDPFEATAGNTAATTTSVSVPGDTSITANALVIGACASNVDSATPQFSDWTNGDLAELYGQINYATSSGAGVNLGVFTGRKVAAGAFGATTATLSATSTQARLTLVVKP